MDCIKARECITPFIKGKLGLDDIEEFLEHIKDCKECREEFEIYYFILVGLENQDSTYDNTDIREEMKEFIRDSYQRIHLRFIWRVFKYVLNTLVTLSVILAVCLQIRVWLT